MVYLDSSKLRFACYQYFHVGIMYSHESDIWLLEK